MRKVTVKIPDSKYSFFMELVKTLGLKAKEKSPGISKKILKGLEQGFKELKLVEEGELKSRRAKDFLNEL